MARTLKIDRTYRRLLGYLARGDPTPFILHNTGISERNFYKKLDTLEKYGYIRKKRTGKVLTIELQPKAIKELGMTSVGVQRVEYINLHDVWIACEILRKPEGWGKRGFVEKILEARSIEHNENRMSNWSGIYFDHASVTVRVTPRKILFSPPQIELSINETPERAKNLMLRYVNGVIPRIESWLKVSIARPDRISMTVSSQHIAFVNDLLAEYFMKRDLKLEIYDDEGRLRVVVDKSLGPDNPHLEYPDKAFAEEDSGNMKRLIGDVSLGRFDHRQVSNDLVEASRIIRQLAREQKTYRDDSVFYGKKIAAHGKSVEALGDGIHAFTEITTESIDKLIVTVDRLCKAVNDMRVPWYQRIFRRKGGKIA